MEVNRTLRIHCRLGVVVRKPRSSVRQHLSYDVCLEVRGEILSELFCVVLCTEVVHTHMQT